MPIAQRRRRSPTPDGLGYARRSGPTGVFPPARVGVSPGAAVSSVPGPASGSGGGAASGAPTVSVGRWPEPDAAMACASCGGTAPATGSSAAPAVAGGSGRFRPRSGPPPASRDRRAASAMAANARGLRLWSLWFRGPRAGTIFPRRESISRPWAPDEALRTSIIGPAVASRGSPRRPHSATSLHSAVPNRAGRRVPSVRAAATRGQADVGGQPTPSTRPCRVGQGSCPA